MKIRNITIKKALPILIAAMPLTASAQDFSKILTSIEANCAKLEAARLRAEAERLESKDICTLENPDVDFTYQFGNNGIGDKKIIEVSQSFDFPTLIHQKRKMAKEMQRVSDLKYLNERQQLLIDAKKMCIEVVYCNAIMSHLNADLEETRAVAEAYEKLYEKGEATIIERNKAHQAVLFFEGEYNEKLALKDNNLNELRCLNGGEEVVIDDSIFVNEPLNGDFDSWLKQNLALRTELQLAEGELSAEKQSLKVAKGEYAPGFRVGYAGEFINDEKFNGPTIGLTLPLWGTKRKVKAAKLHVKAAEKELEDTRVHLISQLRSIYGEIEELQENYIRYKKHLTLCDNSKHLRKSLDSGQMTLLQYIEERQFVHEMHERILATARDLALRKAELQVP